MKVGLVDLDTSHPEHWVPVLRDCGHEVVGVFDHGDVHPAGYARSFAEKLGIPRVFDSLEAMAASVDLAILHGCDWDQHVARARPFVEHDRAVLIDKPIAGRLADLDQLIAWSRHGARISGGSSLRFCAEAASYLTLPLTQRGTPHTVLCGCAVDEFNYGIHAYAMLARLLGTEAISVRHLSTYRHQSRVEVLWPDGRSGLLVIGQTTHWTPFYATVVSDLSVTHITVESTGLYRGLLEAVLPYLQGAVEQPPCRIDDLLQPERWALAALRSRQDGGQAVATDAPLDGGPAYDGAAFARTYRLLKYPATE